MPGEVLLGSMNDSLSGFRVLITQSALERIGGSEVQAYELADYLLTQGAEVTLFVWFAGSPMLDIVQRRGIRVIIRGDSSENSLRASDFDLIWVQHQVLPESVIRTLNDSSETRVVFAHMSPYSELHIEHPYLFQLEERVGALSLFNAPVTQNALRTMYSASMKRFALYPNPVPVEFCANKYKVQSAIQRVLIVSNHPPCEVQEASAILRGQGIVVDSLRDVIGEERGVLTSASLLSQYDVVISIGKTVQYCLTLGVPVYVYDRFGGPGYLNDDNFTIAEYYNFSGRVSSHGDSLVHALRESESLRLDPQVLADDVIERYSQAAVFQHKNIEDYRAKYSISSVVDKLVTVMRSQSFGFVRNLLDSDYIDYIINAEQMICDYLSTIQLTSNPVAAFYRQQIRVFYSNGDAGYQLEQSDDIGRLQTDNVVSLNMSDDKSRYRFDFGEEPCAMCVSVMDGITSNATLTVGNWLIFTEHDPQVFVDCELCKRPSLTVRVYPLSSIPKNDSATMRYIDIRNQYEADRWRRLKLSAPIRVALTIRKLCKRLLRKPVTPDVV